MFTISGTRYGTYATSVASISTGFASIQPLIWDGLPTFLLFISRIQVWHKMGAALGNEHFFIALDIFSLFFAVLLPFCFLAPGRILSHRESFGEPLIARR